ncbi:MAG: two-component regulator propeller domain-containing protein [Phycisphaerales bacterium]
MQPTVVVLILISMLPACPRHAASFDATPEEPPNGCAAPIVAGDAVTELASSVFHIFQASDLVYWFGSDGNGVYRFDGTQLVRFTTEHGLTSDRVRSIQEDRSGAIFVCGEQGGVSRFDGREFSRLQALDSSESQWHLGLDDLWFPGGQDSGVVYRWDGTSLHRLAFPRTPAGDAHIAAFPRSAYPNATYSPYDVYTIFKDSKGHLWFGTASLGACRYDGASFVWVGHGQNSSFGVRSIVEDQDGRFWLSNTVRRFAEDQNAAADPAAPRYREEPGIATDADPYSVFMSTVRDEHGVLWMATLGKGVFRYDGTVWTHFPVTHDDKPIWVYSIYRDEHNALWLGTHEHGVYKLNGSRFERVRF